MEGQSRIREIPEDQLTAEQMQVFKDVAAGRGRLPTPYRVWIHSPAAAAAMGPLGTFLNTKVSLTDREVELGICLIANHWRGEFVWTNHVKAGRKAGLPQAVFDAIRANKTPELQDERERTVYELAVAATGPDAGSDETFARAERVLGRDGIAELLILLGYYSAVAMAMRLHRAPVPAAS